MTTAERAEVIHRILARRRQIWVPIQDGRAIYLSRGTLVYDKIVEAIVVHPAAKADEVCIVAGIAGGAHNVREHLLFPYLRAHIPRRLSDTVR